MAKREDVIAALSAIDPAPLSYQDWLAVGMALSYEGLPMELWDTWSQRDPARYRRKVIEQKWKSFREESAVPVRGETIIKFAYDRGWKPQGADEALDWGAAISDEGVPAGLTDTPADYNPAFDMVDYLHALFDDEEKVCVVVDSLERDGRYHPANEGVSSTVAFLVQKLNKYAAEGPRAPTWVIGDYDGAAGAWIRINPTDGTGGKNSNIVAFRYALVESDAASIPEQYQKIRSLCLPVAALVYSGGKSLHAICRIDADDPREYAKRVKALYDYCQKKGFAIDTANKNPSRLSRLPGCQRGDKWQRLIETDIGPKSWKEFEEIMDVEDNLPAFSHPYDLIEAGLAPRPPELIEGVIRKGQKMLLTGPSKAGKTYALLELAAAIASGTKWMGNFQCAKGRVLYINLELDENLITHRLEDLLKALDLPMDTAKDIVFWNLRGYARALGALEEPLERRCKNENFDVFILDPIYKILDGDENSAQDMRKFCVAVDRVSQALHAAAVYCHHHSKGTQGWKNTMDRGSGSGVFARDPDALLDLSPLRLTSEQEQKADIMPPKATAWRINSTLREFAPFVPVNVWFSAPVHLEDKAGLLQFCNEEGSEEDRLAQGRILGNYAKTLKKQDNVSEMERQYDFLAADGHPVTVKELAEAMGCTERSIRNYAKSDPDLWQINLGFVKKIERENG